MIKKIRSTGLISFNYLLALDRSKLINTYLGLYLTLLLILILSTNLDVLTTLILFMYHS